MGFLNGLFAGETKAAGRVSEATARATGASTSASWGGIPIGQVGNWDIEKAVAQGLERVTWVFRAVDVIAQNQAGLSIKPRRAVGMDRSKGEWIDDDRLWRLLNMRANGYERSWQFRYRLSVNLLLSRRGAFVEVINGRDGRPSELHILPSSIVQPIPDPKTFVSGYYVTRGDGVVDWLPPNRVIWLRLKPHPTDPYAQLTPLMAAGVSVETDFLAHMFNRNFLANDGRPGLLVSIQGQLNPEDADEIKRRFSGGPPRAGETSVIEADGIDIADLSAAPRDLQWLELLKVSKEEILMAFGVPESIMGNASGRTFDNADAERENFWMDTEVPHCDNIAQSFDVLTGDLDDDILVAYDYSTVDVLQRQARVKREEMRTEVQMGLRTIDSYFEAIGEKPWDVPFTRILITNTGIGIGANPSDQAAITQITKVGEPAPVDPSQAAAQGAAAGGREAARQLGNITASRAYAITQGLEARAGTIDSTPQSRGLTRRAERREASARTPEPSVKALPVGQEDIVDAELVEGKSHPYLGLRHNLEGLIEGAVMAWDDRQSKVISERLMHAKSRKGTRHWDGPQTGELKALDPRYSVETERWVDDLTDTISSRLRQVILREAKTAARDLRATGVLGQVQADREDLNTKGDPLLRAFGTEQKMTSALDQAYEGVMDIVRKAAKRQSLRVQQVIADMDEQGKSMRQIDIAVKRMIGMRAKWRKDLSVNVVTSAVEGIRTAVYAQAGGYIEKTWNTEGDERVRHSHVQVDGETKEAQEPFRVGKSLLMHPGDVKGLPEEVVGCRCWLEFAPSDRYYALD